MTNIDWGKPGWIMVCMWLAGSILMLGLGKIIPALVMAMIAIVRTIIVYRDPRGL